MQSVDFNELNFHPCNKYPDQEDTIIPGVPLMLLWSLATLPGHHYPDF